MYVADYLLLRKRIIAFPFLNSPKNQGVVERINIERHYRILSLDVLLRKRLDKRHDDNTIQELKCCQEGVYEIYSDKKGCLNRSQQTSSGDQPKNVAYIDIEDAQVPRWQGTR